MVVEPYGSAGEMSEALQETDGGGFEAAVDAEGWTPQAAAQAQDFLDQLEELADEDPLAAADLLGEAYAAQVHAQVRAEAAEQLRPMIRREYQAADTIGRLEAEFGSDVVAANKERLAEMIGKSETSFLYGGLDEAGRSVLLDAAARHERLRQALAASEYERQAAYARGEDVKAQIEELRSAPMRSARGWSTRRHRHGGRRRPHPRAEREPTRPGLFTSRAVRRRRRSRLRP
jgi:hypothetical protein